MTIETPTTSPTPTTTSPNPDEDYDSVKRELLENLDVLARRHPVDYGILQDVDPSLTPPDAYACVRDQAMWVRYR
ncbi:hypothetical protein BH24ACT5_BH24ACT5_09190 [soil metagenome]